MNVTGPAPIAIVQRYDNSDLVLRLNQRIAAEVLQVTGDRVVLSVNGVQLVARLTSSDQAAQLLERRLAQFVVRDLSSTLVTLQILPRTAESEGAAESPSPSLIQNLLEQAGVPINKVNLIIAKAMVNAGLPVTAELVEEFQRVLEQLQNWGEMEANIAVVLKSLNLPISADSIALLRLQLPPLTDMIRALQKQLSRYLGGRPSAEMSQLAQNAMNWLESLLVKLDAPGVNLSEGVQEAIRFLGRSLEHELAEAFHRLQAGQEDQLNNGILGLALLRRELMRANQSPALLQEIDRFLDGLRVQQFINAEPDPTQPKGQWLRLVLPLHGGVASSSDYTPAEKFHHAEIKIAYLPDEMPPKIDANHTRFVVQVETELGIIAVDVSIAQRKAGVQVLASSASLLERAQEELPTLTEGMAGLGYQVQSARCELSDLSAEDTLSGGRWRNLREVRVEV
jgi:hypothetical protein